MGLLKDIPARSNEQARNYTLHDAMYKFIITLLSPTVRDAPLHLCNRRMPSEITCALPVRSLARMVAGSACNKGMQ